MQPDLERELRECLMIWWQETSVASMIITGQALPPKTEAELWDSPVGKMFQLLLQAARGQLERKNHNHVYLIRQTTQIVTQIFARRASSPDLTGAVWNEFVATPVGQLLFLADLWMDQDELVTLKQASEWTGLSLQALSNRMTRGQLVRFRDPQESNPTYASRVRYSRLRQMVFIKDGSSDRMQALDMAGTAILRRYLEMKGDAIILDFNLQEWFNRVLSDEGQRGTVSNIYREPDDFAKCPDDQGA